ncbi:hypothetical protein GGR50DRAFT_183973 [Xylaria sp. CBS 124048]|nr:hypothetical protein GGR50DRAFT_183973 [Xylaria sp. CBS 124048]
MKLSCASEHNVPFMVVVAVVEVSGFGEVWRRRCVVPLTKISPMDGSTYPTERTRPVSARLDSSETPRILCSRMEETSVGEAFASAA